MPNAVVNLMKLGPNKLHAPGLGNKSIRKSWTEALGKSGGKLTTYPWDHEMEHGPKHYALRGQLGSYDPGAVLEVAKESKVFALALLPGYVEQLAKITKGYFSTICKFNYGNVKDPITGDYTTLPTYAPGGLEDAMKRAIQNGAIAWGATLYTGSLNEAEGIRQIAEMDRIGDKLGLGGVVWNYPRGKNVKVGDAEIFNQLLGFHRIFQVANSSLVLVKEKISTRVGEKKIIEGDKEGQMTDPITEWENGNLIGEGWGKPGDDSAKDFDESWIRSFLQLDRGSQIAILVAYQHARGIGSLMSGGAPQKPDQFKKDIVDGIGSNKHFALIAGRSTTKEIGKNPDGTFDISRAVAHFEMLNEAAPTVIIKD